MLGNFRAFLSTLIVPKSTFSRNSFRSSIRVLNFFMFFIICWFLFKIFGKFSQEYKQFGSRSVLTFCQAWSGSLLFAKVVGRLLIFSKSTFFEKFFQEYNQSQDSSDPDQARHLVRPDLGPNCFQRLSADATSKQRVS